MEDSNPMRAAESPGQPAKGKLKEEAARLMAETRRWWGIYRLSLSWSRFFGGCTSVAGLLVLGLLSYWLTSHFIFQSVQVVGPSMSPTLINTGYYWLDRAAYLMHAPQQGDIVAIRDPGDGGLDVKRIIATPGQSIYLSHGKVYVNGRLLPEPYLLPGTPTYALERNENEFFSLGPDQYFVMGDNRMDSTDSRTFGPVPRHDILGRVVEQ